jgi:hypothetical protein
MANGLEESQAVMVSGEAQRETELLMPSPRKMTDALHEYLQLSSQYSRLTPRAECIITVRKNVSPDDLPWEMRQLLRAHVTAYPKPRRFNTASCLSYDLVRRHCLEGPQALLYLCFNMLAMTSSKRLSRSRFECRAETAWKCRAPFTWSRRYHPVSRK